MNRNKLKILVVEPEKQPYEAEIDRGLLALQSAVGGYIEAVYPFDKPVALICDEEGKISGKPLNRALRDDDGRVYDIVAGTFLIVGLGEESFSSLSPALMEHFSKVFETPEQFLRIGGKIVVLPMPFEKEKAPLHNRLNQLKPSERQPGKPRKHEPER